MNFGWFNIDRGRDELVLFADVSAQRKVRFKKVFFLTHPVFVE